MVEIKGGRRLKRTKSQELPTKKVAENPTLTDHFIIFYRSYEVDQLFYFFKELLVFLFLLIPFFIFRVFFIKELI